MQFSELEGMDVDENEGDIGARLRPIFCSLGEITRADGSVMLCQVAIQIVFLMRISFRETQLWLVVSMDQGRLDKQGN